MGANLLRFFAWQHVLLLPLLAAAIPIVRREMLPGVFAAGFMLPVCIMLVLLPYQGRGFGYRYLHGVLGGAILIAVYGWRRLVAERPQLRSLLLRTTLGLLFVVQPLQAAMANSWYSTFARIDQRIEASGADYFIVGWEDAPFTRVFVQNWPDLSNRPLRLISFFVNDRVIRNICRPGVHVVMPTSKLLRPIETYYLVPHTTTADDQIIALSKRLHDAGCTLDRLDP
jgi:hypothetical protein